MQELRKHSKLPSLQSNPKFLSYLFSAVALIVVLVIWLGRSTQPPSLQAPRSETTQSSPKTPIAAAQPKPSTSEASNNEFEPTGSVEPPPVTTQTLEIIVAEELPLDQHRHNLGTWLGALEPKPNQWEALRPPEAGTINFSLQTPDGVAHELTFSRFNKISTNKGIYSGSIKGHAFSEAMISFVGEAIVGSLRFPDQGIAWEIRNKGDGVQEYEKIDLAKLPGCAACRHDEK